MAKIKVLRNWGILVGLTMPRYSFYIDNLEVTDNILLEGELEIELNSGVHRLSLVSRKKHKIKLVKELEFYVNQEDERYNLVESNLVVTRFIVGLFFLIGVLVASGNIKILHFRGLLYIKLALLILLAILGVTFFVISLYLERSGCGIQLVSEK